MSDRVLITGASAGIGRAAAYAFAGRGDSVFLVARREDLLRNLADDCLQKGATDAQWQAVDLATVGAGGEVVHNCIERLGGVDVLVCNAGFGIVGPVEDVTPDRMARIFQVNFFSAYESIHAALPHFQQKKAGHIVLTSSIVGKKAMPFMSAYCATKFAQVGLGESLWGELKEQGITVSVICPGYTATDFQAAAERSPDTPALKRPIAGQDPRVVAEAIVRAVEKKSREIHMTLAGRALLVLDRISPALATRLMAAFGVRERRSRGKKIAGS